MVFRNLALDSVNRAVATYYGAAGKSFNVAKVLKSLGEEPVAVSFLGGDRGNYLREVMAGKGICLDCVNVAPRTRQCVTVIDECGKTQTELVEESARVSPEDFGHLLEIVRRRIHSATFVVMSGTIAPGGPANLYYELANLATEAGATSVVDAQGEPLKEVLRAGPGLIKPNKLELEATVGRSLDRRSDVLTAMRELHERGAQRVVVTSGADEIIAFDGDAFWRIQPPPISAVNPIGSGDAFTAGVVHRLKRGDDLGEACRWGAAAGAANAINLLAGEVDRGDVERLVLQTHLERV